MNNGVIPMSSGRRFFLIGAGALITSGFVSKVTAHVEKMGRPLLARPDRSDYELYRLEDGLLSLGPYKHVIEVPVPSWREFLPERDSPSRRVPTWHGSRRSGFSAKATSIKKQTVTPGRRPGNVMRGPQRAPTSSSRSWI